MKSENDHHPAGHTFHIPVMGTGHSVDTPIRVAHLGISSVISLVDDILLEKIREHYSRKFELPYERIAKSETDGRARRVTAYLDTVQEIVRTKFEELKKKSCLEENEKKKYFELLPEGSVLKKGYLKLAGMRKGPGRELAEKSLTDRIKPGSIDVNIMVKLDRLNYGAGGAPLSDVFSDAKAALRGYALSGLDSAIVFSAGINQGLFNYMTAFRDFYRNEVGRIKKRIILKVSDFRSALIQGKVLAKKGLEVFEFRIESGLNCGGHAFASNGYLLPSILIEFKEKRDQLQGEFQPLIARFYETMGWKYHESGEAPRARVTVQGGIGTHGEARRLLEDFGMDMTGWASPFLLVPEATCVDDTTRELLRQATENDLYLSDVSPLGIPFNNVFRVNSDVSKRAKVAEGKPGSACPKGFLVSNTEFTQTPICLASSEYQEQKIKEINGLGLAEEERRRRVDEVVEKACICDHLGNGALIALGIAMEKNAPQAICPGPNIAWFNRLYTLKEMVDHIYGRGPSLVPAERPHMFAKEVVMYVDYFEKLVARSNGSQKDFKTLKEFRDNLEEGMKYCLEIGSAEAYEDENLSSIAPCVMEQRERLSSIYRNVEEKMISATLAEAPAARL
ncbi:MAG TPA: hypothetical protein VMM57_02420 [Bacteroidota bacterium]|nr:hypothetical protein [Bacteroidota bacterium]